MNGLMNQIILYDVFVLLCTTIRAERGRCSTKSDPSMLVKHQANVFHLIPHSCIFKQTIGSEMAMSYI